MAELRRLALRHLAGVGDRSAEWVEYHGSAYHLRRRLTEAEQEVVGEVRDCRGTDEWQVRLDRMRDKLPPPALKLAEEERFI
jgi:hypothetical protein